jgi:ribosomal protein L11 methyltransferase
MPSPRVENQWLQVVLRVPATAIEAVDAWFMEVGALGIEHRDGFTLSGPAGLAPDEVELRASFPSSPIGSGLVSPERILADLNVFLSRADAFFPGLSATNPRLEVLDQEDWANNWRDHFSPIRVGGFYVYPGWEPVDPQAVWPVRIDPGLAFGTGMHPTTQLCLQGLDRRLAQGLLESVLDLGCGSGVLALGAARAGVARVVAVDNDPEACRVTLENLKYNGLTGRIEVMTGGPEVVSEDFDLVLANILSGVLIDLHAQVIDRVSPGGLLVLSGILSEEAKRVADTYRAAGCRQLDLRTDGEWCALDMVRSGDEA